MMSQNLDNPSHTITMINRRTLLTTGAATLATLSLSRAPRAQSVTEPIVETSLGKVRGARMGDVYAFRGVRYGAPTGGENRFRPPQPAQPWAGVQDALAYGPQAPQRNPNPPSGPPPVILARLRAPTPGATPPPPPPEGEDCLFLNVWTAGLNDGRRRPVMVWLHGGFFYSGSGSSGDGAKLAARGDVVVVSVNHRLNAFGYTHLDDIGGKDFEHSGNVGMLDIIAALDWVRQNIERFGGDPKRVMVFGPSGGGMKTTFIAASPRAQGLIHRAAVQSGPALRFMERDHASQVTERFLHELNIKRNELGKLRELPAEALLSAFYKLQTTDPIAEFRRLTGFSPVLDPQLLPQHPFDPKAAPSAAKVPMLIGWNREEVTFFMGNDEAGFSLNEDGLRERMNRLFGDQATSILSAYRKAQAQATPSQIYIRAYSDYSIAQNAILQAERQSAAGAKVYLYRLDFASPAMDGRLGALHTLEAPFIFRMTEEQKLLTGGGSKPAALAERMSAAWVSFAANADPTAAETGLPKWPAFDTRRRATMILDENSRVVDDPIREERLALLAVANR
jgi:para-nitrobenzyl esterase